MIHPNEPKLEELLEIDQKELTKPQRSALQSQIRRHEKTLELERETA